MSWSTALAEKAAAQAAAFGEATDIHPAGSVDPVRVDAAWGEVQVAALGQGFVADTCEVAVSAAALTQYGTAVVPRRGDTVTRYAGQHPELRETWEVEAVRRPHAGLWVLEVERGMRPVGRG